MRSLVSLSCVSLLTATALCQSALLREGDPSPSGVSGQTLTNLTNADVNESGGYACTYSTGGINGAVQGIWGNLSGGAGAVLRSEVTVGTLTQTSIEGFFGISGTSVCYSPNSDDAGGSTSLDGVWIDDTVVALEEQPVPGTSNFYSFASRPTITESGTPYYIAGFTDTVGGNSQARALYRDTTPLISTLSSLPGLPDTISSAGLSFDFRVSSAGTNFITEVTLDNAFQGDNAVVLNGAGLTLGGSSVLEDVTIPTSIGGIGDAWDTFDFFGITEAGDYMFTGDTDADSSMDEFIVRAGSIWAREGDTIDNHVVRGSIESAVLSENNIIAYVWDIESGTSTVEALFVERRLLLQEGDSVDWDGDGILDPAVTIASFTGINSMAMSSTGTLYFTADVDVNGSLLEGLFEMEAGLSGGVNYCMANNNTTGVPASISSSGSNFVAMNDFSLTCIDMPTFSFGLFVAAQARGFVMNPGGSAGNLCVSGPIGRFQQQIMSSGSSGSITILTDLTALPQPNGSVPAMAGDTWNFQTWFRDSTPAGGATSNFSDGLEVEFL